MPASLNQQTLFVGVDGGGTKCRVVIANSEMQVLGRSNGGPANPYQSLNQAKQAITLAVGDAFKNAGLTQEDQGRAIVGMGLAGVNIDSVLESVNQWTLHCRRFYLTTDLQIANFAAHESQDGAVLVIGTGSSGFAQVNGKTLSIGGHGFPLGDKGSGAWIGFSAVQAALLALDGIGPSTQLSQLLEAHLSTKGLALVARLGSARQSDFAALAPLVFQAAEGADFVANSIIEEGVAYLSVVAEKLLDAGAPRIAAIGGLAPKVLPYFKPELQSAFSPALHPPEIGAVLFAREQFKQCKHSA